MSSVSVVIPTLNHGRYIRRAIDSVLAQTKAPDEVVVVDDGSTDDTEEVLASYGNAIQYVYQDNQGVSAARNTGIRLSTSNWVAFLDADDDWLNTNYRASSS